MFQVGDYQPQEAATLEYPGSDAEFKISGIYLGGADITGAFGKLDLQELEESILVEIIEKGAL